MFMAENHKFGHMHAGSDGKWKSAPPSFLSCLGIEVCEETELHYTLSTPVFTISSE